MPSINETMTKALNDHLNAETYSAYLYLSMSAYFESIDLAGFANWMRIQAQEEEIHARKLFEYITARGGRVRLGGIDEPPAEWEGALAAFEAAYAHEQEISTAIDDLVGLALEQKDRATESLLRWFVDEQVEEEATVDALVKQLRLGKDSPTVLLMLDRELGARTLTPPAGAPAA